MPSPEPNKEIDELLRAYSKKRREQQPPELHPASRKMLQDTVRQTFGAAPPTSVRSPASLWLRFILGGSLAVVVIFIAVLAVRKPSESTSLDSAAKQLRDKDPVAHFAPTQPATASEYPAAASPPVVASQPPESAPALLASRKTEAAKTAAASVNSSSFGSGSLAGAERGGPQPITSPPAGAAQPALVSAQNVAVGGYFKNNSQQFVQMNNAIANNKQRDPFANVLANFQMEREGRNVLVFDSDGSIYKGRVLDATSTEKLVRPKDRQTIYGQPNTVTASPSSESTYSFEVSGLNNVLKKDITFTGNVVGAPTEDAVLASAAVHSLNRSQNAPADSLKTDSAVAKVQARAPFQNAIQNSNQSQQFPRVTGKLKVDGGVYDIEALPPQP